MSLLRKKKMLGKYPNLDIPHTEFYKHLVLLTVLFPLRHLNFINQETVNSLLIIGNFLRSFKRVKFILPSILSDKSYSDG